MPTAAPAPPPAGDSGPSLLLFGHGLFVMLSGAAAFSDAAESPAALSAIFVSNGAAVLCFGAAAAVRSHGTPDGGGRELALGMRAGLAVPAAYAALCARRATAAAAAGMELVAAVMVVNAVFGVAVVLRMIKYQADVPQPVEEEAVEAMADAIRRASGAAAGAQKKPSAGKKKKKGANEKGKPKST